MTGTIWNFSLQWVDFITKYMNLEGNVSPNNKKDKLLSFFKKYKGVKNMLDSSYVNSLKKAVSTTTGLWWGEAKRTLLSNFSLKLLQT